MFSYRREALLYFRLNFSASRDGSSSLTSVKPSVIKKNKEAKKEAERRYPFYAFKYNFPWGMVLVQSAGKYLHVCGIRSLSQFRGKIRTFRKAVLITARSD